MKVDQRLVASAASLLLSAAVCAAGGKVERGLPPASVSVAPGRPQGIGAYSGHVNHKTKKWIAHLVSEPMSYTLQHWACYDESHAPQAIALEGQIGMMSPGGGNWYHNGFFNFSVGEHEGRDFAVQRIRALDSGERGLCEFLWELPNAWVRVRPMVIPGDEPLYCSIRQVPKGEETAPLKVRLACYPSCYAKDAPRIGLTAQRTVKASNTADLDPMKEPSVIFYDERHDLGVGNGVGGCGALALPELVAASHLDVGGYGCFWEVTAKPGGKELRFVFWAGLQRKNSDLAPYLRQRFPAGEAKLRDLDFTPQRMLPEHIARVRAEMEKILKETPNTDREAQKFANALERLAALRGGTLGQQVDMAAEDEYLKVVDEIEALLWEVRMKWVFAD